MSQPVIVESPPFRIEHCATKATYKAVPMVSMTLNFSLLKKKFPVLLDAGSVLAIAVEDCEVIVHSFGDVLFKTVCDKETMTRIAKKIYECV